MFGISSSHQALRIGALRRRTRIVLRCPHFFASAANHQPDTEKNYKISLVI